MSVICPRCKGKGEVRNNVDWVAAAFTFGITALVDISDWNRCPICDGKGLVEAQ